MYKHQDVHDIQQQYFRKPPALSKKAAIKQFIWNSDTSEYFGRTGSSWAKISLFYLIFYGVLASLVALCMLVFLRTLDPRVPKWQLHESLIGTNPGLGFRPLPPEDNVESTLIWYSGTNKENFEVWTNAIDEFLGPYKSPGTVSGQNKYDCDYGQPAPKGHVCNVDIKSWSPCTHENHYNYHKSSPCIFLKLNKIFAWIPEFYNRTDDLPDNMPEDLQRFIKDSAEKNRTTLNTIWVSCEGENPADLENVGPVKYYPRRGFPGFYFPYENTDGYLSPLVAVHFERPARGIIINIECKAWAKNIRHDRADRIGSVHFELMID